MADKTDEERIFEIAQKRWPKATSITVLPPTTSFCITIMGVTKSISPWYVEAIENSFWDESSFTKHTFAQRTADDMIRELHIIRVPVEEIFGVPVDARDGD